MVSVTSCPACGEDCSEVVALLDAQRAARFVEFDILKYDGLLSKWLDSVPPVVLRCRDCEHCWYRYQPVGEQLGLMYATGKTLNQDVNPTREAEPHMRREMRRLRKLVGNTSANPATLLDFGSGVGRWARAAVLENFSVTAYEPSVERGSENDTPFELVHSIGELENRKFDVIQLEQVLEHVPDPLSTLKQLREVCKPHTIMRISVPNLLRNQDGVKVWATWPFDGQAPHFLAPFEHLHGFTPSSLDRLLKRAGYRDISVKAEAESAVINLLRRIIGRIFPILNSTLRYVRPES